MYQKSEIFLGNVKGEREREIKYVKRSERGNRCYDGEEKLSLVLILAQSKLSFFYDFCAHPTVDPTRQKKERDTRRE